MKCRAAAGGISCVAEKRNIQQIQEVTLSGADSRVWIFLKVTPTVRQSCESNNTLIIQYGLDSNCNFMLIHHINI